MNFVIKEKHNKDVVTLDEDSFLQLLKIYYNETGDIEKSFKKVKKELLKKLLHT